MKAKERPSKIESQGKLMRMVRGYAGIKLWSETERDVILTTMKKVKHMGIVAALLGISRTNLYRKLKAYRSRS